MQKYKSGAIIRGTYIEDNLVPFGGRDMGIEFLTPEPASLIKQLPLGNPVKLADLYRLSFDDILDYLEELASHLNLETNSYMQEALEASCITANQTQPLLKAAYQSISHIFSRDFVREVAEQRVGVRYLEDWVPTNLNDGRVLSIRAFGARALHIIAGNAPVIAAISIMRNAITRSDAIIKSPSNDPFTALAIARTMADMAPDHPLTKHLSVAYWKGGDQNIEMELYRPHNIEKIVAWGGLASIRHVTKYIQPGLELITLDPKRSVSIIGPEALQDEATQKAAAVRLATDIGALNQEGCVNARVVYVLSGTDDDSVEKLNQFGQHVYDALLTLPESVSTRPKSINMELRSNIKTAELTDDWYKVIGGEDDEGAIIVSQIPEPVEFAAMLASRVANLVPIDSYEELFAAVDAYTQTVGVYPESLKKELRDKLPLYGAQRLTSLGYAAHATIAAPQDAVEPLRRMCKWIVEESCDPEKVIPLWKS